VQQDQGVGGIGDGDDTCDPLAWTTMLATTDDIDSIPLPTNLPPIEIKDRYPTLDIVLPDIPCPTATDAIKPASTLSTAAQIQHSFSSEEISTIFQHLASIKLRAAQLNEPDILAAASRIEAILRSTRLP